MLRGSLCLIAAMKNMQKIIEDKLREGLNPTLLEVTDFSAEHAGHIGAKEGGQSHFHVKIESENFRGISRPEQHRLVYALLALELKDDIHALRIEALIPKPD